MKKKIYKILAVLVIILGVGFPVFWVYQWLATPDYYYEIKDRVTYPDEEILKRISCDSVLRLTVHREDITFVNHYKRSRKYTATNTERNYTYDTLGVEYNLKPDTLVNGVEHKCGERILANQQMKYFEGSKSKPFTRNLIMEFGYKGVNTFVEYENTPKDNSDSALYGMFFRGGYAQWLDTIMTPLYQCVLASGDYSPVLNTRKEAKEVCETACRLAAKTANGFDFTEFRACTSTYEIKIGVNSIERECGIAKVTVNRERGLLSSRPRGCNSRSYWKMTEK